jgi:hypothetical protein
MTGTKHFCLERTDRAIFIFTTRGMGEPVAERKSWQDENATMILTDTGVIVVKNAQGKIVTMYYCTVEAARWVVNSNHIPSALYRTIEKNIKRGYLKMQNSVKY